MKKKPKPTSPRNAQAALSGVRRYLRHRKHLEGVEGVFAVVILAVACVWAFWRAGSGLPTGQPTPQPTARPTLTMTMPTPAPVPSLSEIVPDWPLVPVPSSVLVDAAADYGIVLTPPPEPTGTPVDQWALDVVPPPWPVDCTDDVAWNGYIVPDFGDYCVPGILSQDTLNAQFPRSFYGVLSSYGQYAMEIMEDRAGVRRGHGVALTTCGQMGFTVWLRIPGEAWRGPFRVVDCGAPAHLFHQVVIDGLVAEISWTAAQTWVPAATRVDVQIGSYPGNGWDGVYLASWWVANALRWEDGYGLLQHNITRTDGTIEAWPPLE